MLLAAWFSWLYPSVRLSWRASSGLRVLGYNVYRTELINDEIVRINEKLITTDIDPLEPTDFSIEDSSLKSSASYKYQIQAIYEDGSMSITEPIDASPWQRTKRLSLLGITILVLGFLVCAPAFLCVVFKNKNLNIKSSQNTLNEL